MTLGSNTKTSYQLL